MSRTKNSGRNPQQVAAAVPLLGALNKEGENNEQSTLLQMVLGQMAAHEQERKLEMAALQATLKATQDGFIQARSEWDTQLKTIKRDNAEAINAVREQFQKIIESKPIDPSTWKELYKAAMTKADKQMAEAHAAFVENLKTMPTGTIVNDEGKVVRFLINGVSRIIKPGRNKNMPQAFVEEWQKRIALKKWALGLENSLADRTTNLSANEVAQITDRAPVWDDDRGRL